MMIEEPPWPLAVTVQLTRNQDKDDSVDQVRHVAYGVVGPIIVTIGLLGNLLTMVVLSRPQFRGVTYTYFLLLAVSDFLSLAFSISVLNHLLTEATLSHATALWYSYFELLFVNIPMSMSVFIVICITIDRFLSVCRPIDFKLFHTARYARMGLSASLLVAVLTWIPTCFLKVPEIYSECDTSSFEAPDNRTWWVACIQRRTGTSPYYIAYSWIRQTIVIFLPIVILVALNSLTVREFIRLRKIKTEMRGRQTVQPQPSEDSLRQTHHNNHLIVLLMAVMISFFVTLVPAGISNAVYTKIYTTKLEFEIFMAVANDLELLNHSLNFYLYMMCSKPIREAIRDFSSRQYAKMAASLDHLKTAVAQKTFVKAHKDMLPSEMTVSTTGIVTRRAETEKNDSIRTDKTKTLSGVTITSDLVSDKTSTADPSQDNKGFSPEPNDAV